MELGLRIGDVARSVSLALEGPTFRVAILPGELLRVPRGRRQLRVVSGTAWLSSDRGDELLGRGEVAELRGAQHDALISDIGGEGLFLEIA
ncbi:MAG TPA: hypothetical protein VMC79_15115 [Rectinemataceae bacterium]|nr:hypothetical protein [Rectinemataceae bacterium]